MDFIKNISNIPIYAVSYIQDMRQVSEFIPPSILFTILIIGGYLTYKGIQKIKKINNLNNNDEFADPIKNDNQEKVVASFGKWITEPASATTINSIKAIQKLQIKISYTMLLIGCVLILSTLITTKTIYL